MKSKPVGEGCSDFRNMPLAEKRSLKALDQHKEQEQAPGEK